MAGDISMSTRIPLSSEAIGLEVLARRRRLGMTQQDLARVAGLTRRHIRLIERGRRTVPADQLQLVYAALHADAFLMLEEKQT